jgi:hypothetical protein
MSILLIKVAAGFWNTKNFEKDENDMLAMIALYCVGAVALGDMRDGDSIHIAGIP